MKNILAEATQVHELLAICFYEAHLKEKSNLWFEGYNSNLESNSFIKPIPISAIFSKISMALS